MQQSRPRGEVVDAERPAGGHAPDRPPEAGSAARSVGPGTQITMWALNLGPALFLIALVVAMSFASPYFATERNVTNLLQQSSMIAMIAIGQLVVIISRGIDISAAGQVGFAAVIGATLFADHESPAVVVILVVLGMTAAIGLINGAVYIFGKMPHPFIVTIGTYSILRGLAYVISPIPVTGVPDVIASLGTETIFGIVPLTAVVVAVVATVIAVLLRQSRWGRWVYAIGGSPEAASRTGIPVNAVLISTYVVSGLCAGIAALLSMAITQTGDPSAATDALLDAIVAVVIGGASFLGGRGNIANPLIGALIIGVIRNGMDLLSVNSFYQLVVLGVVLLLAVGTDVQRTRLVGRIRVMRTLAAEGRHV